MAMILNEEQQLLRESARDFLAGHSPVAQLRSLRDSGQEWSEGLWAEMADMGWAGIVIPETYGGLEFGFVGAGLLAEECGRTLATSPFISTALVCASILAEAGTEDQKSGLLPAIAAGERVVTLAWEEPGMNLPSGIALTASRTGDDYLLEGTKVHVIHGAFASDFIVPVRTAGTAGDPEGLALFLVSRDAGGLEIVPTLNADNHSTAELRFSGVKQSEGTCISATESPLAVLQNALDIGAVGTSAELLGIAEEAFERTLEYLKERKQFGVPVGSFQALQHRAAILFCELHLCRSLLFQALGAIDGKSDELRLLASSAKTKCGRTVRLAVNEAVQMHGGIGMTDEFDLGFFMKRAAAARQEFGDEYYHCERFALLRGY
jgi:alkylation response protein AidB-like acyl-CoA dehydrogenase